MDNWIKKYRQEHPEEFDTGHPEPESVAEHQRVVAEKAKLKRVIEVFGKSQLGIKSSRQHLLFSGCMIALGLERCSKAQALPRTSVELMSDLVEVRLLVGPEVGLLRQILSRQSVSVLGRASLPGTARSGEERLDSRGLTDGFVLGQLPAPIPCESAHRRSNLVMAVETVDQLVFDT